MAKVIETVDRVLKSEECDDLECSFGVKYIKFVAGNWPLSEIDDLIKFLQEEKQRLGGEGVKEVK